MMKGEKNTLTPHLSQEIHAENLWNIHAVQEMQVFENSIEELPKIKNILSASNKKPTNSSKRRTLKII